MAINFTFRKDVDEEDVMYTKKDNKQFMSRDNVSNIVKDFSRHLFQDIKMI